MIQTFYCIDLKSKTLFEISEKTQNPIGFSHHFWNLATWRYKLIHSAPIWNWVYEKVKLSFKCQVSRKVLLRTEVFAPLKKWPPKIDLFIFLPFQCSHKKFHFIQEISFNQIKLCCKTLNTYIHVIYHSHFLYSTI